VIANAIFDDARGRHLALTLTLTLTLTIIIIIVVAVVVVEQHIGGERISQCDIVHTAMKRRLQFGTFDSSSSATTSATTSAGGELVSVIAVIGTSHRIVCNTATATAIGFFMEGDVSGSGNGGVALSDLKGYAILQQYWHSLFFSNSIHHVHVVVVYVIGVRIHMHIIHMRMLVCCYCCRGCLYGHRYS